MILHYVHCLLLGASCWRTAFLLRLKGTWVWCKNQCDGSVLLLRSLQAEPFMISNYVTEKKKKNTQSSVIQDALHYTDDIGPPRNMPVRYACRLHFLTDHCVTCQHYRVAIPWSELVKNITTARCKKLLGMFKQCSGYGSLLSSHK